MRILLLCRELMMLYHLFTETKVQPEKIFPVILLPANVHHAGVFQCSRGVHLRCINPECREQIIQRIIYWVKNCSIENVAEASIRKLFDLERIKGIKDLYELTEKDFEGIEGFAEKKNSEFYK